MAYLYVMHPGNRLRQLRKAAKLSQADLGDRTGMSQEAISQFENGKRPLTLQNMRAFAREIGCSVADLLDDDENPDRLGDDERAMIIAYRASPSDARDYLLTSARAVADRRLAYKAG